MDIEQRLNRLEVNQMHIIELLEQTLERLPQTRSEAIDDPKVPKQDREMWGKYVATARQHHVTTKYALDRCSVAADCEYLANNPKASDANKKHFTDLEETAYEMAEEFMQWTPFSSRSKLQKWFLEFKNKKNVTTPWEFLKSTNFK